MTDKPGQRLFISHIDVKPTSPSSLTLTTNKAHLPSSQVVYGDQPSQAPSERVRELHGESDDINYQYGGKYVWLVPRYTSSYSTAAVGFEIVIQGDANGSLKDLAKGAGGDFRYLLPIKDVTKEAKVTQVALLRLDGDLGRRPAGWSGNTIDINKNRGKTFLYLLWKNAL
ncbi:hypothetical protein GSI_11078 [Ganoderma sinense ZZ0214-1]|uniref:Uncharacterized protein n=1 Tax=Ganoderma sinense ZZ0214-1 TaxID=1077348 RepID=A0A2G8RZA1_9APHY|nr:hypothetical protein GSI_11078 [Ganoderma sinense ZZ0214-1]